MAEVLITLGIIGIVAAMTLPSFINNSRNKQLEAGLKHSYSVISQALDMFQAENGERIKSDKTIGYLKLKPILIRYFKTAKDCDYGFDSIKSCIKRGAHVINEQKTDFYKTFNGKSMNTSMFDEGQFVLQDESMIFLQNGDNETRIMISVDVNGYNKNPNKLGHDLFMFMIDEQGALLPMGAKGSAFLIRIFIVRLLQIIT